MWPGNDKRQRKYDSLFSPLMYCKIRMPRRFMFFVIFGFHFVVSISICRLMCDAVTQFWSLRSQRFQLRLLSIWCVATNTITCAVCAHIIAAKAFDGFVSFHMSELASICLNYLILGIFRWWMTSNASVRRRHQNGRHECGRIVFPSFYLYAIATD